NGLRVCVVCRLAGQNTSIARSNKSAGAGLSLAPILRPSGRHMHRTLLVTLLCGLFLGSPDASPGQALDSPGVAVEEVRFRHADNVLAGSLFRPKLAGPHPAVVLVLGSGAQDRRYGGAGTALGKHFASHGFVCLAWDKPGVGESTGDYNAQTFRDRAEE